MLISLFKLVLTITSIFLISPQEVYAYLDPGSGSYLVQIIIASVAGLGILIKAQWDNIKNVFINRKNKQEEKSDED